VPGRVDVAVPGVPWGRVVITMYCAPGVPATPFGTAVMILAGAAPAGRGEAITIVCLPAADCDTAAAVPGLATPAPAGVPASTEPARPLMMVAPLGNVYTQTDRQTRRGRVTDRHTTGHTQASYRSSIVKFPDFSSHGMTIFSGPIETITLSHKC